MTEPAPPTRSSWSRWLARLAAALAILPILLLGVIAFASLSVDVKRWREPIATALTHALGREVEIRGSARLKLSLRPELVLRDIRIENPPGFPASAFATVAELRLASVLLPLLRRQVIVNELRGRQVTVRLERSEGGRGNWVFEAGRQAAEEERAPRFRFDWRRVVVERAVVEYAGAAAPHRLELDSVAIEGLSGLPLRLSAQGTAGPQLKFRGEADSAPLAELAGPEPWPFTAQLESPGSAASIHGTRQATVDGPIVRLRVEVRTTNLAEFETWLGTRLSRGRAAALAGELEFAPGAVVLRDLDGHLAGLEISGEVAVATRGPRPRVSGHLAIPEIDVWGRDARTRADASGGTTLAAVYEVFRDAELHLARLAQFDADLDVTLGGLANSPGELRDVRARIQVDAGRLLAPFTARMGGAAIEGALSADAAPGAPRFGLRFAAHDAPVGGLVYLLFDLPHVAGTVHRFEADFSASGATVAELLRNLDGRIGIEGAQLTYGNYSGARPVEMHITAADLAQPRGAVIAATVRGSLRGKAFEGSARADTVERLLRNRRTPFLFEGRSSGVRLRLSGILAEPGEDAGPDLGIELSAPHARELTPWLGFSSQSAAPVTLNGRVRVREDGVGFSEAKLVFGHSSITGELDWQRTGGKARIDARLAAELLVPAELGGLRDPPTRDRARTLIDIPILPETLDFGDADLDLAVKRVDGLPLDIVDLAFAGRMRGGAIEPSPFTLQLQGNPLGGTLALDARGATPTATLALEGDEFDAGAVLQRLRIAQGVESRIGKMRLALDVRGSQLGDVFGQSSMLARFEAGTLTFRDAGTRAALNLTVDEGELRAEAGGPVTGSIVGSAGTVPARLDLQGGPLRDLLEPAARWPFSISAVLPGATLVVSGSAAPQRDPAAELSLTLNGGRLNDLDALLETALPPWGPYELTGTLRITPGGYAVSEMRLAIGASLLLGSGSLDTRRKPPRLEVALRAPLVQLDDFPPGEWSPVRSPGAASRMSTSSARRAVASGVEVVRPLLSRERLELADAQVEVRAERLAAGEDELGRARIAASVNDGAATLGPIEIDGNAGRVSLAVGYEPREQDAVFSARALFDRLDYGLVAARLDPAANIDGVLSLDLELDAITPDLSQVLRHSSGHIDLAVWPDRLMWGGFDLWAGNLLRSLLPLFSPASSQINCVIGQFDLHQGALVSQALIIDTTNTRALGSAEADFATERLHLRFVPRHKRPRLFSLAVPVEVRGTFDNYRIALRPLDALGRVAQWFKALVQLPLSWFGVGRIPRNGQDVCASPSRRVPEHPEPGPVP